MNNLDKGINHFTWIRRALNLWMLVGIVCIVLQLALCWRGSHNVVTVHVASGATK